MSKCRDCRWWDWGCIVDGAAHCTNPTLGAYDREGNRKIFTEEDFGCVEFTPSKPLVYLDYQ